MKYQRLSPSSAYSQSTRITPGETQTNTRSEIKTEAQTKAKATSKTHADPTKPPVVPRAGVISVVRRQNLFLLVRRLNAPDAGLWGFPGGKVEPGERLFSAAERELKEETGLTSTATHIADIIETIRHAADGTLLFHYVITAICCIETGDEQTPVAASDDAMEARWFSLAEIGQLGTQASSGLYNLAIRVAEQDRTNTLIR
ncbi:NUDIX hydrolase [Acetobacter thailandicus]|uniref:NUDIX hydrolase n=1 Tax=Acetobacter thailandicus TaxID=1502842 RepID=UPI001BA7BBFC|nr:NUDIX hydrolase [Acetobacter thailandicus]MBS1003247.1 NUDIX hydrolase [Acetobacter thailandicus]